MLILGFSGWAGSGKNTAGSFAALHLTTQYNLKVQMASFAAPLKKMALEMGWDGQKNDAGRFFLQKIGETYRAINPNYWINLMWEDIEVAERNNIFKADPHIVTSTMGILGHLPHTERLRDAFIITDVRYKNEAEWLTKTAPKEGHQTALWRVSRTNHKGLGGSAGKHASECDLDDWDFNGYITAADGDFEDLNQQTRDLVDTLMEN